MTFDELAEFNRDLKILLKKYRTLHDDLDVVKTILKKKPDQRPPFSFRIDLYHKNDKENEDRKRIMDHFK